MDNFIKTHNPYIEKDLMLDLIKFSKDKAFSKSGTNSSCCIVGDYAILKTGNIEGHTNNFDDVIETLNNLKSQGVNIARILGYAVANLGETYDNGARYDKGYIVQEKAPGKELFDAKSEPHGLDWNNSAETRQNVLDYCKMLREAPQEQIDKYIADYKKITDSKISVDPSKLTNFFYDKEKGFTFIDLNFKSKTSLFDEPDLYGKNTHRMFLFNSFCPIKTFTLEDYKTKKALYTPEQTKFITQSMCIAFSKFCKAAQKVGITQQDIEDMFVPQETNTASFGGFHLFEYDNLKDILKNIPQTEEWSF